MEHLRQRTLAGLGWSGATQLLGQVFQFAFSVALARLLSPAEFGLIGMILVFTGFASSLADLGSGAFIIGKPSIGERHLNSVFWLNVAVGGVLTILFSMAAPLVAHYYSEPQLRLLTVAVAFNFLLVSLTVVQNALLSKAMDFRTRFWIESLSAAVSGISALVLAMTGAGVWSLVGQSMVLTAARTLLLWWRSPWRPGWSFDPAAVKELLRFGRHLVAFNAVIYWEHNVDRAVIGRLIGGPSLGIYNLAERIMRIPSTNVTGFAGAVMFPALCALQSDVDSVKRVYLRSNRLIALVTFPMMAGLWVLAEPAMLFVLGEKWRSAIAIVRVLCLAGMAQSVYNTAGWIYLSNGRPDILLRVSIYAFLARVAGVLVGMRWGILGIAWAYVLGVYACVLYPSWSAAGRLIGLRFLDTLKNVSGPFFCATGMATVAWLLDRWLLADQALSVRLAVGVLGGVVVYGFLIHLFRLEAWGDLRKLMVLKAGT
jgi:O-antigen/teichoic acid export membrane protein